MALDLTLSADDLAAIEAAVPPTRSREAGTRRPRWPRWTASAEPADLPGVTRRSDLVVDGISPEASGSTGGSGYSSLCRPAATAPPTSGATMNSHTWLSAVRRR